MIRKKTFKDNNEYLKFINKMRDRIDVIELKKYRNGWKIEYEDKL